MRKWKKIEEKSFPWSYVVGLSDVWMCVENSISGIRHNSRSQPTRVKDKLPPTMNSSVECRIPFYAVGKCIMER